MPEIKKTNESDADHDDDGRAAAAKTELLAGEASAPSVAALTAERPARFGVLDALVLTGALVCLLWGLGEYSFYEPHEGHFAGVGREMLLRGDWIVPHLNGAPYLNKPPLFYWMIAGSCRLFGINEWGARLPLALIGWVCAWLLWWWGRRLWGPAAGRCAVVLLSVSAGWYLFSHQLLIDLLLSTLNLAAFIALWAALRRPKRRGPWVVLYAVLALGVLSKGFVALLFPFCAALAWLWCAKRAEWKTVLKQARLPLGAVLVLGGTAWWALWVEQRNPGFIKYIIVNEHLKRLFNERVPKDYNELSIGAFWLISFIWTLPAGLLLPAVVAFIRRQLPSSRRGLDQAAPEETSPPADSLDKAEERRRAVFLSAVGAAAPVVLFTLSPARLAYYGLPAVPLTALLTGGWWATFRHDGKRWEPLLSGATLALVGAAVFSAGFWAPPLLKNVPDMRAAAETVRLIPRLAWLLGGALFVGGVLLAPGRGAIAAAVLFVGLGAAGTQAVSGFESYAKIRSSKALVEKWDPLLGPETTWVFEGSREIGAAAGISRYLKGKAPDGRPYRVVYVMSDDPRRPLPAFNLPPDRDYRLNRAGLRKLWFGPRPVVFITDFLRTDWKADPPTTLPDGLRREDALDTDGRRYLFANEAAARLLKARRRKKIGIGGPRPLPAQKGFRGN